MQRILQNARINALFDKTTTIKKNSTLFFLSSRDVSILQKRFVINRLTLRNDREHGEMSILVKKSLCNCNI